MESGGEPKARRLTQAVIFHVGMLIVVLLGCAAIWRVRFTMVLPGMYLAGAVRNCGPSLGIRTWLHQDLVHETRNCEYGCGSGMRALCRATERGYRIDHDVLIR
jgi:hypothetical protein